MQRRGRNQQRQRKLVRLAVDALAVVGFEVARHLQHQPGAGAQVVQRPVA